MGELFPSPTFPELLKGGGTVALPWPGGDAFSLQLTATLCLMVCFLAPGCRPIWTPDPLPSLLDLVLLALGKMGGDCLWGIHA